MLGATERQEPMSASHLAQMTDSRGLPHHLPPHPHSRLDASGIRDLFEASTLAAPPVPASLEPTFVGRDQWAFASRPITPGFGHMAAYHAWPYLHEMLTAEPEDYVAVIHGGHGLNSYTLNYFLKYRRIAIVCQIPWGGVYSDAEHARTEVAEHFASCRELIDAVDALPENTIAPRRQLVVVDAELRGVGHYGWVKVPFQEDSRLVEIPPSKRVANMLHVVTGWTGWHGRHRYPARAAAASLGAEVDYA